MRCRKRSCRSTAESARRGNREVRLPVRAVGCGARSLNASFQSIFLQPPVHGAAAEAQGPRGFADVAVMTREGALNQITLHVIKVHFFETRGGAQRGRA